MDSTVTAVANFAKLSRVEQELLGGHKVESNAPGPCRTEVPTVRTSGPCESSTTSFGKRRRTSRK